MLDAARAQDVFRRIEKDEVCCLAIDLASIDRPYRTRDGGRLRVIVTVQDPVVVRTIPTHLGLPPPTEPPGPARARPRVDPPR